MSQGARWDRNDSGILEMTRLRNRFALMVATGCVLVGAALVSARGQQMQAPDPERGFAFGDTNLDGKLSMDEFVELIRVGPRLKKAAVQKTPAQLEPVFHRLDTDHNGFLTVQEFSRLAQLRAAFGGGAGGAFAKGFLAKKQAAKRAPKAVIDQPVTSDQAKFFESKIRPVLVAKCVKCHDSKAEKTKGGLVVDTREGLLKGGDTGPAVVPGDVGESLLITAIRYKDESLQMPPKTRLPDDVVADFEKWVALARPSLTSRSKIRGRRHRSTESMLRKDGGSGRFSLPKPPRRRSSRTPHGRRRMSISLSSPRSRPKGSNRSPTPGGRRS